MKKEGVDKEIQSLIKSEIFTENYRLDHIIFFTDIIQL